MRHWIWIVVVSTAAVGCEKKQPRFDGPMPVTFGDCGGTNLTWVSGPRPLAFTQEQAEQVRTAAAERAKPPNEPRPVPTPTPPPTPPTPPPPTTPAKARQLTRQEAIEQAREAGILGTTQQGGAFASLTGTGDFVDDTTIYGGLLGGEAGEMSGGFGFGRAGFGPGGGGTGWGTIGTGGYGTIGHGSGSSRGGMRGRRPGGPSLSIGSPSATGSLDKAIIRRYIKRNIQKLQYCYEKQLLVTPKLAGTVTAEFTIGTQGMVASSNATGLDPTVADCVKRVIASIEFPRPKGGVVQVKYPFTFRPADGAATPDPGVGSAAAGSATDATQDPPPAPPTTKQPAPKPPEPPPSYKPGEHNPLRGERDALEECLRKNPKPYGALVVELGYDRTGAVTSAVPYGLDGDAAKPCLVEIARKIKRDGPGPAAERCSIAFGQMQPDDGPVIALTADAITLNGTQIATPQAVLGEQDQHAPITPVFDRVKHAVDGSSAPGAPVVAIRGPGVIRPAATTPIGLVTRVVTSVLAAGDDYVLAAQEGTSWRLLRTIDGPVPIVPVPVGTGGSWNARFRTPGVAAFDPERVQLSLLVEKDQLWVGLSRINEFQVIPRTGHEWDELAKKLAEHRQSAFFVDREDLEIAGDTGVSYGDIVHAIDAASKAGFPWWQLTDPQGLSARPSL